jgi:hypothetical protein
LELVELQEAHRVPEMELIQFFQVLHQLVVEVVVKEVVNLEMMEDQVVELQETQIQDQVILLP